MRILLTHRTKGRWLVRTLGWQFDVTDHRKRPPFAVERFATKQFPYPRLHLGPYCLRLWKVLNHQSTEPTNNSKRRG